MILTTHPNSNSEPVLTDLNGRDDREISLSLNGADIHGTCSMTWKNEHYLFGGYTNTRQIRKLSGCSFENLNELDFEFQYDFMGFHISLRKINL